VKELLALTASLLLGGCTTATVPAVVTALDALDRLTRDRTGRPLEELPMVCEHEQDPETGRLLMLCTVCYRLAPGEVCK